MGCPRAPLFIFPNAEYFLTPKATHIGTEEMDQRAPISSRTAKIVWLLAHPSLWQGSRPEDDQNWRQIIKSMKLDGLIAQTTYPLDVNIPGLITEALLHQAKGAVCNAADPPRFGMPLQSR